MLKLLKFHIKPKQKRTTKTAEMNFRYVVICCKAKFKNSKNKKKKKKNTKKQCFSNAK